MRSPVACLVFVLAACGARTNTPPPHRPTSIAAPPPPSSSGPSEAECEALYTHAIDLVIAERQPPPPEADRTTLRAELRPAFVADCRAGSRTYHQCGLAAKSAADLQSCR